MLKAPLRSSVKQYPVSTKNQTKLKFISKWFRHLIHVSLVDDYNLESEASFWEEESAI